MSRLPRKWGTLRPAAPGTAVLIWGLLDLALVPAMAVSCALAVALDGWCGISRFGTGRFGQTTDLRWMPVLAMLTTGVVMGLPVAPVPWSPYARRWPIGLALLGLGFPGALDAVVRTGT